jgi:UPF0755 protein
MSKKKIKNTYRNNLIKRSNEARTVRKIVSIIILALIVIIAIGGISGYLYIKSALEPIDPTNKENIEVTIPMGSSTSSIANILEENDIIKDARIFRFYIKFKNESDFQAGEYVFNQTLSLDEIIESLKAGKMMAEAVHTITIPEGKTIQQIATIYANQLSFTEDEFIEKVNDVPYIEELISEYPILTETILDPEIRVPLEGYLFAATYEFYEEEPTIEVVIENMLDKTMEIVVPFQDDIAAKEFTVHEAITFASLLENEARTEEQRKQIAGVFYNRLDEGMKLQTDPTVLYALGGHKDKVLLEDLKIESPYNTYVIDALPIGPISNFAQNALEAVFEPEESDFIYFLHDAEGNIHYSVTYDEHLAFKKEYID